VTLACHDVRTPLATVQGFARTLQRTGSLGPTEARYVEMIVAASGQIGNLVEDLALVARIQGGRYEPTRQPVDTLRLAEGARDRLGPGGVTVSGTGDRVSVEAVLAERALAALAECARRHGGVESVHLRPEGTDVHVSPVTGEAAPVILAEQLRDLGAATARIVVEALGGSIELVDDTLVVHFPA
jgi:signal transduction histidine kinase